VSTVERGELEALAAKYRALLALRADTSVKDDARLRALAARFPGVLRELDTRTVISLERRLEELEVALAGGQAPSWAVLHSRFHGWLRVALRMRVDGVRDLEGARAWASQYVPRDPGDPAREDLDDAAMMRLMAPPKGRISLAASTLLGLDDAALTTLLSG
jgi:hypothetical protein